MTNELIFAQEDFIVIDKELTSIDLGEAGYYYHIDSFGVLTIDEITRDRSYFVKKKDHKSFAPKEKKVWAVIPLKLADNLTESTVVFEFRFAHIGHYRFYVLENGALIEDHFNGDSYPFGIRSIRHNYFVEVVPLKPNSEYHVIYELDSEGQEIPFNVHISDYSSFEASTVRDKLNHGIVIGVCLIFTLIIFVLYLIFRDRYFLLEVGMSISSILYILAEEGYGYMYIWPMSPEFNGISRPLFVGLMNILMLYFTIDFLKFRERNARLYRLSLWVMAMMMAYMFLIHPFDLLSIRTVENLSFVILTFLISMMLLEFYIIGLALYSWRQDKNRDGLIILTVLLVTLILIMIRTLSIQGILPNNALASHTGLLTRGIHIPLMGLFLLYRAKELIQESQKLEIELLEEKSMANKKLIKSVNDERHRVAMALHDSVGGLLTGLRANFEMLDQNCEGVKDSKYYVNGVEILDDLSTEMRRISNNLYPNTLKKFGLDHEMIKMMSKIESLNGIKSSIDINNPNELKLDEEIQLQLFFILKELTANATRHSEAKNVWMDVHYYDDEIHLVIEDDGRGFNLEHAMRSEQNGLSNIKHRIKVMDGKIDIYSRPSEGTSISINIPARYTQL